jgi:hypothetical protein
MSFAFQILGVLALILGPILIPASMLAWAAKHE